MSPLSHLSVSLFGYNRQQVDQMLTQKSEEINRLEASVNQQVEELAALQKELNHYREIEQALQDGIVDARITGNKIMEESSDKANSLLKQTNEQVRQYKENFVFHSQELVDSGVNLKRDLKKMKEKMLEVVATYQELIEDTDFDAIYPDDQVDQLVTQMNAYDSEEMVLEPRSLDTPRKEQSMTEEERRELESLIHEVMDNEQQASHYKLVNFKQVKEN